MYTIQGHRNETYTIHSVQDMTQDHPTVAGALECHGKEPKIYHMERVIEGTRKQARIVQCYRFAKSGNFISIA